MKIKDLAKEYALNNTDKLDDSREYMITVISESYKAGFEKALSLFAVSGQSEQLKAFCQYCETRQIQPKRFKWDEVIKDFESL